MADNQSSTRTDLEVEAFHQNSRESFWDAFRKEFSRKRLGFNFSRTEVFTTSQWHFPRLVFVVYRLVIAAYAISVLFLSIVRFNPGFRYPWPAWLTNWSYFMLTCHLLCSAVVAVMNLCDRPSALASQPLFRRVLPFYIKLSWFFYVIASSAAFFVTIVYFSAMFPMMRLTSLSSGDIHLHLMNSVLVILELAISAIPVRLLHFIYVLAYCIVYVAFSAIYWAFDHYRVLYPEFLDWNHPLKTFGLVLLLVIVGLPILQCILFAAYRLRLCVYNRIYHSKVREGH